MMMPMKCCWTPFLQIPAPVAFEHPAHQGTPGTPDPALAGPSTAFTDPGHGVIIHCSHKLAAKLTGVSLEPLEETSPLAIWHGHLVSFDRRQCVMFMHDDTRYALFLPGLRKEHFAVLGARWFWEFYTATLAMLGCPDRQIRKVELALGPVRYDTATDRSVQSSIRVAKQDLEAWVYDVPKVMELDPLAAAAWLNERPATVYGKPV
jgi:hypothetical protein